MLGRTTGLSDTDVAMLNVLLRTKTIPFFDSLSVHILRSIFESYNSHLSEHHLSLFLDVSSQNILRRLTRDAPLVRTGLVVVDKHAIRSSDRLDRLCTFPHDTDDVMTLLLDIERVRPPPGRAHGAGRHPETGVRSAVLLSRRE